MLGLRRILLLPLAFHTTGPQAGRGRNKSFFTEVFDVGHGFIDGEGNRFQSPTAEILEKRWNVVKKKKKEKKKDKRDGM